MIAPYNACEVLVSFSGILIFQNSFNFTLLLFIRMKLSVIIVNYNVKFFLDQCLQSVIGAIKKIDAEVFVVDNNSVDGSVAMVKEKFATVKVIENHKNIGFSAANNIAIKKAAGNYILLLNPDTVVEEDTFTKCLDYLDKHPEAGALGVKMIDGKGKFLPESKRGLPTPQVSFYKIFGLSGLFPKSKEFGRYHLSFLPANQTNEVDVLCGAFMMIRKKALDAAGLLDETFFMYGEDIDLSYRIQKAGFKIVYFPETTIIHYKGESTKKSSLNYVYLFYKAMQIFAQKHFSYGKATWLYRIIQLAIYFRATLSVIKRLATKAILPLLDFFFMYVAVYSLSKFWGHFWFENMNYYSSEFYLAIVPAYIGIWFLSLLFSGAYDHPLRLRSTFNGIITGTIIILVLYALLPKNYHFSRVIILFGAMLALCVAILNRVILSATGIKRFSLYPNQRKRIIVTGSEEECTRVSSILKGINIPFDSLLYVSASRDHNHNFLGSVDQLPEIVRIHKADEVIFCLKDLPASEIISSMLRLAGTGCDFKIAPSNTDSIIGSNSINTAGDLYVFNANPVASAKNSRLKRTFDITVSLLLLVLLPIWIWKKNKPRRVIPNIFSVLFGKKTWVGYSSQKLGNEPTLKPGVFSINQAFPESRNDEGITKKFELAYTQDYRVINDFRIFVKAFFEQSQ